MPKYRLITLPHYCYTVSKKTGPLQHVKVWLKIRCLSRGERILYIGYDFRRHYRLLRPSADGPVFFLYTVYYERGSGPSAVVVAKQFTRRIDRTSESASELCVLENTGVRQRGKPIEVASSCFLGFYELDALLNRTQYTQTRLSDSIQFTDRVAWRAGSGVVYQWLTARLAL